MQDKMRKDLERTRRKGRAKWPFLVLLAAILGGTAIGIRDYFDGDDSRRPGASMPPATTATAEPCRVEADDPAARAAAAKWCGDGVFTLVNVSTDASNFVAMLQFSRVGLRSWAAQRQPILDGFRNLTDEMVDKTGLNVAFSLLGTDGQLVAGCNRARDQPKAICK